MANVTWPFMQMGGGQFTEGTYSADTQWERSGSLSVRSRTASPGPPLGDSLYGYVWQQDYTLTSGRPVYTGGFSSKTFTFKDTDGDTVHTLTTGTATSVATYGSPVTATLYSITSVDDGAYLWHRTTDGVLQFLLIPNLVMWYRIPPLSFLDYYTGTETTIASGGTSYDHGPFTGNASAIANAVDHMEAIVDEANDSTTGNFDDVAAQMSGFSDRSLWWLSDEVATSVSVTFTVTEEDSSFGKAANFQNPDFDEAITTHKGWIDDLSDTSITTLEIS